MGTIAVILTVACVIFFFLVCHTKLGKTKGFLFVAAAISLATAISYILEIIFRAIRIGDDLVFFSALPIIAAAIIYLVIARGWFIKARAL